MISATDLLDKDHLSLDNMTTFVLNEEGKDVYSRAGVSPLKPSWTEMTGEDHLLGYFLLGPVFSSFNIIKGICIVAIFYIYWSTLQ